MKKLVILIFLLCVAAFVYWSYLQLAKRDIQTNIATFFSTATAGDEEAVNYLDMSPDEENLLLDALQIPGLWQFEEVQQIRITSLKRATVRLVLTVGDKTHPIEALLMRNNGTWQITAFPKISILQQTFITKVADSDVTIINGNSEEEITLKTDIALAPQDAGFAVGVDGTLVYFEVFDKLSISKLIAISDSTMEGETTGIHTLADDLIFLQKHNDTYKIVKQEAAILGMQNIIAYQVENVIQTVLLPDDYQPNRIRVILNTTGFNGLSHQEIRLTVNDSFSLEDKVAGSRQTFSSDQLLRFKANGSNIDVVMPSGETKTYPNRLHIIPAGIGRTRIESLRRGSPAFIPAYRGTIEITNRNAALLVINEVPMEAYLYSVVPSEMPISFGEVPLQVQAVAARSYAVSSIYRSGLRSLSAHVDDSISSQVYNNVPEYAISSAAVDATKGMVVRFNNSIADTRFFSTASGVTANFHEVWHDEGTKAFPGTPLPYLVSRAQLHTGELDAVNTEAGAREFFATTNWDAYDQPSPWFRWQVEMSRTQLEAVLNRYLAERQLAQPEFVLTAVGNTFAQKKIPANPIGELKDLRVIKRGTGGNLMELDIEGENGTYRLRKEYTIRFTIRPVNADGKAAVILKRHDGSTLNNYTILPSAFVVFDIRRDNNNRITSILFQGGGNGHGVGMSQFGTRGLAAAGQSFQEILLHYYPGCSIEKVY